MGWKMSHRMGMNCGPAVRHALLALVLAAPAFVEAGAVEPASGAEATLNHAHRTKARSGIDGRVELLTKALDLNAKQQAELRKILEGQREQVGRLWADEAMPPAYRVKATQAIGDRTADQIRAMLTEEQKQKYNPPRPAHEATATSSVSVEDWMNKTRPK